MEYSFVRFTGNGSKLSNYSISVNASFSFGILSGFYSKENINKFKKVVLFFDEKNKAIAFHFTNDENAEGAFAVAHVKNSASIGARTFFVKHELLRDAKFLGKKLPRKIKDEKLGTLFVIDLINKQ